MTHNFLRLPIPAASYNAPKRSPATNRLSSSRNYVFTYWGENPPLADDAPLPPQLRYICFQQEEAIAKPGQPLPFGEGPRRRHWQGYVEFAERISLKKAQHILQWARPKPRGGWEHKPEHPHFLEERKGTQEQARAYALKKSSGESLSIEGTKRERGIKAAADAPGAWKNLVEQLHDGKSFNQAARDRELTALLCRNAGGVQKVISALEEAPTWRNVTVNVYWGPTGTGKTRRVYEETRDKQQTLFRKPPPSSGTHWFTGMDKEEALLIDEFHGDIPITMMLNLLDGHPLKVNTKGGDAWAHWTTVYITTNIPIDQWYPRAEPEHIAALRRRITNIDHMKDVPVRAKAEPDWQEAFRPTKEEIAMLMNHRRQREADTIEI